MQLIKLSMYNNNKKILCVRVCVCVCVCVCVYVKSDGLNVIQSALHLIRNNLIILDVHQCNLFY